ncbi:MAG: hypothetical protein GWN71_40075 [Gammaproteobacteria bacterium]|nr:hypothetical protein [Gammaproteobacteria bacterium]
MINRLKPYLNEPDEGSAGDYYVILADFDTYYVSRAVADRVTRTLGRPWPPRWIRFTDLTGADVRIRARLIHTVQECTAAQRATARELRRAQRREERADRRPWEDDDWW